MFIPICWSTYCIVYTSLFCVHLTMVIRLMYMYLDSEKLSRVHHHGCSLVRLQCALRGWILATDAGHLQDHAGRGSG